MDPDVDTPIRVRLTNLAGLAPADLGQRSFRAWLTAPIAGEPLYKRTLGVLMPLRILELVLEPGAVGETVLELFEQRPIYNLKARMARHPQAVSPEHAATLLVPLGGLLEADLPGLVARGQRAGRTQRTPVGLPSPEAKKLEIVYLPPGHSAADFDPTSPATDVYSPAPPILRPTAKSVSLRELGQRALEGDLGSITPAGPLEDGLLVGKGAEVDASVRVVGKAAVGAGSHVGPGVVLGPGAVIGEGCRVGSGAHVIHSMVLDGCHVEERERLLGVVRLPDSQCL